MPEPSDDPSVFREPHLQPQAKEPDPSEAKADATLGREAAGPDAISGSGQSVYDEPDIFPGRRPEVVWQDWSCSRCGYNLRGLPTGHPCPECGHRELYRPPPPGAQSYQSWLQERLARTSPSVGWYVALAAVLLGGPLAVIAALIKSAQGGLVATSSFFVAVVFAPAVEETMKIAAAAFVVEVRPYLFRRVGQIQFATVGTACVFAVIENFIYLNVYVPNPSAELVIWRWTVCVALHVACTLVASRGLTDVWKRTVTEFRPPKVARGLGMLAMAIVIHGGYNAIMFAYQLAFGPVR